MVRRSELRVVNSDARECARALTNFVKFYLFSLIQKEKMSYNFGTNLEISALVTFQQYGELLWLDR